MILGGDVNGTAYSPGMFRFDRRWIGWSGHGLIFSTYSQEVISAARTDRIDCME